MKNFLGNEITNVVNKYCHNLEGGAMACNIHEITLGALLHDIGKLLQRAFGTIDQLPWSVYDMESTLCPKGRYQNYTHRHVLFTNAFFDLIQQKGLTWPAGIDHQTVTRISSFHHRPDNSPEPYEAWICTVADWCSSGLDRKADEEEDAGGGIKSSYRQKPLRCIFDEIIIDSKRPAPEKHGYPLNGLAPNDPEALMPVVWKPQDTDLPKCYRNLWDDFWSSFQNLMAEPGLTPRLLEEAVLGLLERFTWAIPSSTMDLPDISLYDHLRTTAAIAACLFRYHEAEASLQDTINIKNENSPKFRFLAGDLSGLQNTLFTLESQGVKGSGKILRARSFMLGAISESAALQVTDAFKVPNSCVVQEAGGRFLVLLPAIEEAESILQELKNRFDQWLLRNYTGSLSLNLSLCEPFPAGDFRQGNFSKLFAYISKVVEESKQKPFSTRNQGVIVQEFPYDRACSACGVRPAQVKMGQEYRCHTCQQEYDIGKKLTKSDLIVWSRKKRPASKVADVLGLDLVLGSTADFSISTHDPISIRTIKLQNSKIPWAVRTIANYVPRFRNSDDVMDPRYEGVVDQKEEISGDMVKTFAHIGAEALEKKEDGTFRGKPFLGMLKADVDHLGAVFSLGLRREQDRLDRFTLSRMAQLSRMIDLYFTGYLQGVIERDFPDTYTIYAGGDDLLLIGPWRQMLNLSATIEKSFSMYVGHNPNITISAGFALMAPNQPINRAVLEAEEWLHKAKVENPVAKNRIGVSFGARTMTWSRFSECLSNAEWVHEQMQGKRGQGTGFVYRILQISDDERKVRMGDVRKAGWLGKLAYHMARNINGRDEKEKREKRELWLRKLGFTLSLNASDPTSSIGEWRFPLSVALYRNRK